MVASQAAQRALRLLMPGLRLKRWFLLMIVGVTLIGLAIGLLLAELYREVRLPAIFYYLTLQFFPRWVRALLLGGLGITAFLYGLYQLNAVLVRAAGGEDTQRLLRKLVHQHLTAQGPRVTAIGGGHGLAALLRGLKRYTSNITAIVTVADDGGSSGRLRREMGVLPPGDFRMCIAALADDESLVTQLMQYRFGGSNGLSGHSFGNLFIVAMAELTGSFERAVIESSRVVASQGRILPSTLTNVTLCAEYAPVAATAAPPVRGESSISKVGLPIERVWLDPQDPPAYPDAVKAVLEADVVVIGPGSLFTSVMPNLLVPGIAEALRQTRALRVYVCNVATERGETDRFTMTDHVRAIERHIGPNALDVVLANNHRVDFALPSGVEYVLAEPALPNSRTQVVGADLINDKEPWRHDSDKLARAVLDLIHRRNADLNASVSSTLD
ncbi:MAG: uridine diphosphate-N-acetylglucosamine-binding protein YvcK [Anaerolineae bacterium]|nr:uridine diphosphate-N-acetylglucosamine-binding protein YvcK [Anaerolineae bacterium]